MVKTSEPIKKLSEKNEKELTPLETLLQKTDVLLMLYPKNDNGSFLESIQSSDERTVYNLLHERETKESLLILLDTSGGNVYSAVKIMDCLRSNYSHISIAIPQEAKSSGTMMCFGADHLIMSSISELGPLDKPLPHPDHENSYISALDIVKSIDGTIDTALERQQELATDIRNRFGTRITNSLELASEFVSKLISPMLSREDVKIYNQAKRLLAIAETYGTELLNENMLNYIKNERLKKRVINSIIRQFVWLYPDHAFAVRRDELRGWFFVIDDAEKQDYWKELWKHFEKHLSGGSKTIKFL